MYQPKPVIVDERISKDEIRERGLVFQREIEKDIFHERPRFEYQEIGPDWLAYHDRLRVLGAKIDSFIQRCLGEGRVLVFDYFVDNAGLQPAERWQKTPYSDKNFMNMHFILARDLPKQWFPAATGPRKRKDFEAMAKAQEHLESRYVHRDEPKRYVRKQDFIAWAEERFGLPKKAATDIWEKSNIPEWRKGGRRKESYRITL